MGRFNEHRWQLLASLLPAVGAFGIVYGAACGQAKIEPLLATASSLLIFAGGAQFSSVAILAAGGSPTSAVVAGLLINARFVPLGMAIASRLPVRCALRMAAAHLLVDETAFLALAEADPRQAERTYILAGVVLLALWNGATFTGVMWGATLDFERWGLDAAMPAAMLALAAPWLRSRRGLLAAAWGAGVALLLEPHTPAGVPLLAATSAGVWARRNPPKQRADGERPTWRRRWLP